MSEGLGVYSCACRCVHVDVSMWMCMGMCLWVSLRYGFCVFIGLCPYVAECLSFGMCVGFFVSVCQFVTIWPQLGLVQASWPNCGFLWQPHKLQHLKLPMSLIITLIIFYHRLLLIMITYAREGMVWSSFCWRHNLQVIDSTTHLEIEI